MKKQKKIEHRSVGDFSEMNHFEFREMLTDVMEHGQFEEKLVKILNRSEDAKLLFFNSVIKNGQFEENLVKILSRSEDAKRLFFKTVIKNSLTWALVIGISLVISALVVRFSDISSHIVEKAINSQVPELIPPRQTAKAE